MQVQPMDEEQELDADGHANGTSNGQGTNGSGTLNLLNPGMEKREVLKVNLPYSFSQFMEFRPGYDGLDSNFNANGMSNFRHIKTLAT